MHENGCKGGVLERSGENGRGKKEEERKKKKEERRKRDFSLRSEWRVMVGCERKGLAHDAGDGIDERDVGGWD